MQESEWKSDKCLMELVSYFYRKKIEDYMIMTINNFMRSFQTKMKRIIRIPRSFVDKFKKLYFRVETNKTCMEAIVPRVMFAGHLGYEVIEIKIVEYATKLLKAKVNDESEKWGIAKERMVEEQEFLSSKARKKSIERVLKKILKVTSMNHEEYIEAKQTVEKMRAVGQRSILLLKPLSDALGSPPSVEPILAAPISANPIVAKV